MSLTENESPITDTPNHYDNSNGSLYLFASQHNLNSYEFDVIKRIVRCREKGEFKSDVLKTIKVLEIYLHEQGHKYDKSFKEEPNYLFEKLKSNIIDLTQEYPNDIELGKEVRKLFKDINK